MTRFIYIADTHFGVDRMAYQQQKGYPEKLGSILSELDTWIRKDGEIDFVLHGGDMINSATEANIREARDVFRLSVPVYLCLGNHDLTAPDALDMWLTEAPEFFPGKSPDYYLRFGDSFVHVMPNHWEEVPYYWNDEQNPHFLGHQTARLDETLRRYPDAVHILSTHSPVFGIPVEQTGFDEPYHSPPLSFTKSVLDFVQQHPRVRCVLTAHNHVNTHIAEKTVHFVTPSSLTETPFEFKLIELSPEILRMSTVSLISHVDFQANYDYNKTFVQGRERDREFEERL